MKKYDFKKIEAKWQKVWQEKGVYEPALKSSKGKNPPFYNLMMFPYPSAEGLHVGNMYAFTGTDIYGRYKRMQGNDVFEPIGLDGFGIHSENYAMKIGAHPMKQAKVSEKRFYKQLQAIGNGFAWNERLETYDPEYYRWTQWIFAQMFKAGLAYRKKQAVNWCPSCMTVLSDEQAEGGKCERCNSVVIKKDLEQWFFKITEYAERLLQNLDKLDWSEKVKIAQKNWIGKSEGAELEFGIKNYELGIKNALVIHGVSGHKRENWFPWLKDILEKDGWHVSVPTLPTPDHPKIEEWNMVLKKESTSASVLIGHSLGAPAALNLIQTSNKKIDRLILVAPVNPKQDWRYLKSVYPQADWDAVKNFADIKFDWEKITKLVRQVVVYYSDNDPYVSAKSVEFYKQHLPNAIFRFLPGKGHFNERYGITEFPEILEAVNPKVKVFTTRPDTLFGATYVVLAPEHPLIQNLEGGIKNVVEVKNYIKKSKAKTDEERIENKEKTGVELRGVKAINPATQGEISIWVADYVLSSYGTGAIMAVPAHDERDHEFASKYKLPIVEVVDSQDNSDGTLWLGGGRLINSGRFNGVDSEEAKWKITAEVGGKKKIQYRLRDWLISRQRYWGPPIPMIHCEGCEKAGKGERKEMPGWYAVPDKDLPVKLPFVKDFRPQGSGSSPLAASKAFRDVRCPVCKNKAKRETDVSDTFLDSAWYYLRYPSLSSKTAKAKAWDPEITKSWCPVDMYIGGAEHSVLHLLYVRFLALALHDLKLVNFGDSKAPKGEPFPKFRAHGLLIKEGAKMSKSKGNVVNPDEYIKNFGADTLRMYLMFLAPFEQGGDFRDAGVMGISRFLERVYKFSQRISDPNTTNYIRIIRKERKNSEHSDVFVDLDRILHQTIKKVSDDLESLSYNTAISAMMILLNKFEEKAESVSLPNWIDFLKLLAPFAPHLSEELFQSAKKHNSQFIIRNSIHLSDWPQYNPELARESNFTLIVQINGKVRASIEAPIGISEKNALALALRNERVKELVSGDPKRVIFIPNRLINLVI